MREFTEKHHAFIAAVFYVTLTVMCGAGGRAALVGAPRRPGQPRGSRRAQRATRDGRPLDFASYFEYGEWTSTQSAIDEGCNNQLSVLSYAPDLTEKITVCPWAAQFKEMGLAKAGSLYCAHIDASLVRGFNPALVYEVPQTMHESGYCLQIARGANFGDGKIPQKHGEYMKGFDYHCGHIYKTFSSVATAVFGAEGQEAATEVLSRFAEEYGSDLADTLTKYHDTDFDLAK